MSAYEDSSGVVHLCAALIHPHTPHIFILVRRLILTRKSLIKIENLHHTIYYCASGLLMSYHTVLSFAKISRACYQASWTWLGSDHVMPFYPPHCRLRSVPRDLLMTLKVRSRTKVFHQVCTRNRNRFKKYSILNVCTWNPPHFGFETYLCSSVGVWSWLILSVSRVLTTWVSNTLMVMLKFAHSKPWANKWSLALRARTLRSNTTLEHFTLPNTTYELIVVEFQMVSSLSQSCSTVLKKVQNLHATRPVPTLLKSIIRNGGFLRPSGVFMYAAISSSCSFRSNSCSRTCSVACASPWRQVLYFGTILIRVSTIGLEELLLETTSSYSVRARCDLCHDTW